MIYSKSQRIPYALIAAVLSVLLTGCVVENMGPLTVNQTTAANEPDCEEQLDNPNQTCVAPGESNDDTESDSSITAANAATVVNSALEKIELAFNLGYAGGTLISGVETETSAGSLATFFRDVLNQLQGSVTQYGLQPTIIGTNHGMPLTLTCEEGRTEEATALGDGVLQFQVDTPCTINNLTFEGTFNISQIVVEGDWNQQGANWSRGALFSFAEFTISISDSPSIDLTGSFRYNADFVVDTPADEPPETGIVKVEDPVGITIGTETDTLSGGDTSAFGIQYGYDYRTELLTLDAFGDFSGSNAGGVLSVSTGNTNAPLSQQPGDDGNYHSGILVVTASDSTTATLQVLDATNVTVDANSETQIPMTWDELRSS